MLQFHSRDELFLHGPRQQGHVLHPHVGKPFAQRHAGRRGARGRPPPHLHRKRISLSQPHVKGSARECRRTAAISRAYCRPPGPQCLRPLQGHHQRRRSRAHKGRGDFPPSERRIPPCRPFWARPWVSTPHTGRPAWSGVPPRPPRSGGRSPGPTPDM